MSGNRAQRSWLVERRGLLEIFLKACQVGTMRRRDVFQVEEMRPRRSWCPFGRRGNVYPEGSRSPFLASRSRTFGLFDIIGEDAGVGLAFVAAAGAAIQGRFIGIVVRCAAMGAEQARAARNSCVSPIMRRAVSTVSTCSSK